MPSRNGQFPAQPPGSADDFIIIEDGHSEDEWPLRFRSSDMPLELEEEELIGLRELNVMCGGQPSEKQLGNIIDRSDKRIVIVDVRQEPHGYVAGSPVTWYRPYISDLELGAEAARSLQGDFISAMKRSPTVEVQTVEWTGGQDYRVVATKRFDSATATSDEELSEKLGIGYERLYIPVTPTTEQVGEFERFVADIREEDVTLYFHCWDGTGRTTEFAAMYDIIRNGQDVSFGTIVKRQAAMGGVNIIDLPPENDPRYQRSLKRKEFVEDYYRAFTGKEPG